MNKEQKMKILERLVKEGHITLCEAFELSITEKEYVFVPNQTFEPISNPLQPFTPYYPTITF